MSNTSGAAGVVASASPNGLRRCHRRDRVASIGTALLRLRRPRQSALARQAFPAVLVLAASLVRAASNRRFASMMAALGVCARALWRGRASDASSRAAPARVVYVAIAAVLALGASELVLRRVHLRAAEWLVPDEEPRRRPDPRLGWTFVPARTGHSTVGGRVDRLRVRSGGISRTPRRRAGAIPSSRRSCSPVSR